MRAAGLAVALALLLLAGSPEAAGAGLALLLGRLVLLHARPRAGAPPLRASVLAVAAGLMLAAPQVLPTLVAWGEAARGVTGHAGEPGRFLRRLRPGDDLACRTHSGPCVRPGRPSLVLGGGKAGSS
jgi:hypothetical protein